MNVFNRDIAITGYIDKNQILKFVSEQEIFKLVFGYEPQEYDYVVSPFRKDTNPGCWFSYSLSGKLRFTDFGSPIYMNGVKMISIDCFDAVQYYFKLPNLYQTLRFIKTHLIDGKNLKERPKEESRPVKEKEKTLIRFVPRDFTLADKKYWFDRYQIHKESLIQDKIFPVEKYAVIKQDREPLIFRSNHITYAINNFSSGNVKLYAPLRRDKFKFISNCVGNDIGGDDFKNIEGETLIITKSYKDYRVLKNQGIKHCIYFQSESMFPELHLILVMIKNYNKIVVLFDNDTVGLESAEKLSNLINSIFPNRSVFISVPIALQAKGIKDPSDIIHKKGRKSLLEFLNYHSLL